LQLKAQAAGRRGIAPWSYWQALMTLIATPRSCVTGDSRVAADAGMARAAPRSWFWFLDAQAPTVSLRLLRRVEQSVSVYRAAVEIVAWWRAPAALPPLQLCQQLVSIAVPLLALWIGLTMPYRAWRKYRCAARHGLFMR
jgi:hypothetical protein